MGEVETCDTVSPEAVALERRDWNRRKARRFLSTSFSSLDDFKKTSAKQLLFFHVFEGHPSEAILSVLSEFAADERVVLLDVCKDRGFLKSTPICCGHHR